MLCYSTGYGYSYVSPLRQSTVQRAHSFRVIRFRIPIPFCSVLFSILFLFSVLCFYPLILSPIECHVADTGLKRSTR